jgi:hypothetical protein
MALVILSLALTGVSGSATNLDLTTLGASGFINSAYFQQTSPQPTGTGVIKPFVRVRSNHNVEQAYNTTVNNTLDVDSPNNWNHEIRLSDIPTVTLGNVLYRQFFLDINQTAESPLLSLDEVQVFLSSTPNQSVETFTSGLINLSYNKLVYRMDTGGDNRVTLNYSLNHGSGSGDMFMYIADSLFTGSNAQYVYLYSKFGQHNANNAGFEEWSTLSNRSQRSVPEPASLALIGAGIFGMATKSRWKK